LRAVLDEEVGRLPEHYRAPFVLCYFQGRTNEEAARELGRPVGTILSRLSRAREQLRARLIRRGLAPAGVASVLALAGEAGAVPLSPALVGTTVKAAVAIAAGEAVAGAVLAPVAALTEGVLRAMYVAKLKMGLTVLLALTLVSGG